MADKTPFVINDRRKFTAEGELRQDIEHPVSEPKAQTPEAPEVKAAPEPIAFPSSASEPPAHAEGASRPPSEPLAFPGGDDADEAEQAFTAPTAEQSEQAARAYEATVDRLDTAIRATNPGMERVPEMNLERFVQSLYMQAIVQLGGAVEPGQTPQVDILGARQTIDMLAILADKTKGNLAAPEDALLQSALFEARMGFLEVTQALARQTAAKQTGPGSPLGGGPRVVR